jgi:hypothetical protein
MTATGFFASRLLRSGAFSFVLQIILFGFLHFRLENAQNA